MIRAGLVAASLLLAGPGVAETAPAALANEAASHLKEAADGLERAGGARDRVRALTETVQAYEQGLSALRSAMRQANHEERVLSAQLSARDEEISQLLGVLTSMGRSPAPLLLLHPSGPLGTARSGMMLSEIAPEVQAEARALRAELEKLAELRALQQNAGAALADGLRGAQEARTALSQAMAARTDLPRRFAADPARMAALIATAESLSAFAEGLADVPPPDQPTMDFTARKGRLPLPVSGILLRGFNEPDAAGIARPGLLLATRPGALVTAPAEATIRYVGPLLDYGNVIILEPSSGILLVLAGLGGVYGTEGEVVLAGQALGFMGGQEPRAENAEFLAEPAESGGAERSETLYMELREGESPVDPSEWFAATQG
ncbi:septal ring factor EnvC (AmiA/AmiB activator) [Aliiruegeria haliotis]|uniref:Septal ring factor EnvC (AmiA/AmiB activator) n=1 Tax=Aliiruegeria haliotis TaxID=1280846 RepID=A0A2T0RI82_9RHOB|nr:peptidoglycan DD-metalloendopeptidase family protein [Aliiruegeria haliotis]PRY20885.1 septal ring factor EnvC (AmiA/AmiB activator) [Aliiruegeria haliotis]